eukprot:4163694-Pleurochrysis_carterae.AAC.1
MGSGCGTVTPALPFFSCVRVEREYLYGRRANSAGSVRPVLITLHTPLTLKNTLPLALEWALFTTRPQL